MKDVVMKATNLKNSAIIVLRFVLKVGCASGSALAAQKQPGASDVALNL